MLSGHHALLALESRLDDPEHTRSSYWDVESETYTVTADGTLAGHNVLGNYTADRSAARMFMHWALQMPFRFMVWPFTKVLHLERLGRRIAERQNRIFTHDMMRQILTLAFIDAKSDGLQGQDAVLVIGDGYGFLSSLVLAAYPDKKVICVNLTKSLLVDALFVEKGDPAIKFALCDNADELTGALSDPSINFLLVQADNVDILETAPIGLAINVVSMQEMDLPVVEKYFRILRQNPANVTIFYCCNKLMKQLPDKSRIKFENYPWAPDDIVLHDSICTWSQWYYSKRFPFWHYRFGVERIIWHRLANLAK